MPEIVLVHTSYEIELYSEVFRLKKKNRINFLHYFSYNDNNELLSKNIDIVINDYVICAGNHRDINTFVSAVNKIDNLYGIVIGSEADRIKWENSEFNDIKFYFNLPYVRYRKLISGAKASVISIKNSGPLRSLGLISAFEAISLQVPIIASNTFHLKDYFSNNEISFYTPDDSNSLAEKIEEISSNNNFYKMKAYSALKKMNCCYNKKVFLQKLYKLCILSDNNFNLIKP